MSANVETINDYFKRYEWHYEYDTSTRTWVTGFRGDINNFNVLVHLAEDWLYFIISPFVNAPSKEECERNLYHHLLRINHAMNMAKFSIDGDHDVVLTVELPTESLDYSEFSDGINALSYYADQHYMDVLNLAQNPNYQPQYQVSDDDDWRPPGPEGGPN
ncbi:MAG: YbjN domain-containing protein [Deltaproteobacteria bacterium]|nr:YbjN domain-containing protein [Deltaproteobacteria bacterium]